MKKTKAHPVGVVVNDDPVEVSRVASLLDQAGVVARVYESAEAALAAMNPAAPPDLIVMALDLPGIDGWRCCRLLRSAEYAAFNAVPLVVVSATFAGDHLERVAADAGADAFRSFPLHEQAFIALTRALLAGREAHGRPRTLLVADDHDLAAVLTTAFAAHDYEVDTAFSIREAEAASSAASYDLAVLDRRLTGGTGDTLLDCFRTRHPDCVCVMMAAEATPAEALTWMKRGVAAYLCVPFTPESLIELCTRARREHALVRAANRLESKRPDGAPAGESLRFQHVFEHSPSATWLEDFTGLAAWLGQLRAQGVADLREYLRQNPGQLRDAMSLIRVLDVNPAALAQSAATSKEQLLTSLPRLFEERTYAEFQAELEAVWEGREQCEYESHSRRLNGEPLDVIVRLTVPRYRGRPDYSRVVVTSTDITARMQAEARLRESEERHRSLFMEMQEGFALHEVICDAAGRPCDYRYLEVNPAFERATGIPRERWLGHTVREVLPGVEDYWIQGFGEVALTGTAAKFENYVQALDQYYEVVAYSPKRGQFAVVVLNVTERRRLELALRWNEERLRETARIARVGGWEIDLAHNTLSWTEETFRIHELAADRVPCLAEAIQFYHPDDQSEVAAEVQRAAEGGESMDMEARLITAKKNLLWVRVIGNPVWREGRLAEVRGVVQDITERKQTELNLQRRDALLNAALRASTLLLTAETPAPVLGQIVRLLGEASSQDRAYYFSWRTDPITGKHTISLRHEWVGAETAPQQDNPLLQELPFDEVAPYSCERLRQGLEVCALVRDLPASEREVLEPQGIVSLLLMPVMVNGVPEGFVGFDNCRTEHAWTAGERAALAVVAVNLGAALARSRAEAALRASEERYRSLIESSPDAIGIFRSDKLVYVNPATARLLGAGSVEDLIGLTSEQIIHPEDRGAALDRVRRLLAGESGLYPAEVRYVRRDGAVVWGEVIGSLVQFGGQPAFQFVARDITERKRAEEQVRLSEEKYRALFNQSTVGIYLHDLEGRVLDVNEMACAQSGYSREEWLGRTVFDGHPSSSRACRPRAEILQTWRQWPPGRRLVVEAEHQRKDGTVYPVEISTGMVQYGDAHVMLAMVKDITQRKLAGEALKASARKYRQLVENTHDIIYTLTADGVFQFVSPAWTRILGHPVTEVEGHSFMEFVHPEDLPVCVAGFRKVVEMGEQQDSVEYRVRHADGTWRWHVSSGGPVRDTTGAITHYDGIARDITARKRAEAERERAQAMLQSALAQSPAGILIADAPEVTIRWANAAALDMRGESRLPLTGIELTRHARHWQTLRPDGRPYLSEELPLSRAVLRGEVTRGEEVIIRHASGEDRWVSVNAAPIRDPDGVIAAGIVVFADISERKRAEEALRRRDAVLEAVSSAAARLLGQGDWQTTVQQALGDLGRGAEASRAYVFEFHPDADGTLLASQRFEWTSGDVAPQIGNPDLQNVPVLAAGFGRWAELLHGRSLVAGHVREFPAAEQALLLAQAIRSLVVVPIHIGDRGWGFLGFDECRAERVWSDPEIGALRTAARTLGAAIAREWGEQALRESQGRYQSLVETLPQGIFRKDREGRFTFANAQFCQAIGRPVEQVLGQTDRDLCPPELATRYRQDDEQVMATGQMLDIIVEEQGPGGETRYVNVLKTPLRDAAGRVQGVQGIFWDVTGRKRAEAALQASLDEKTVLLRELHHRVKNNLQIVCSLMNLQAVRVQHPEALATLRETGNRVRSMAILHEMLYRSESLTRVRFATYLENLCVQLRRSYGSKTGAVQLECRLSEVSLGLDTAVSCGLIVNELVSNALKHAFPAGRAGLIVVELNRLTDHRVRLSVADDGVGLPPGLDLRQTETLGHQLVYMLAEKLGGTVDVSRENGTRFSLAFPVSPT